MIDATVSYEVLQYIRIRRRRVILVMALLFCLIFEGCYALSVGSFRIDLQTFLNALLQRTIPASETSSHVLLNIRLPRILSAVLAGSSLAMAGAVMQNLLKNPLASPFTLGISHGAAFGAAVAILCFSSGRMDSMSTTAISYQSPYLVVTCAFGGALLAAAAVMILSGIRNMGPESMVLAGVAMSSLFSAATMVLQYLANELQVASMVFWTFGDVSRPNWNELLILLVVTGIAAILFKTMAWDMNALLLDEEEARSLGVNVTRLRLQGMFLASLMAAVITAFMGVIGFVGLLGPHMARRFLGEDHVLLLWGSAFMGAVLLLVADTLTRAVLSPFVLPVGTVTSFLGAPLFLYLLIRRRES
ncbi:MAG: iron ABC transporter permease [Dissulfuribacterales bacterium]